MSDDSTISGSDESQVKNPAIHTQYVETYGRALLAGRGGGESVKWPNERLMTAATTIAISDAIARRKIKTPGELVRALRGLLEIGGVNFKDLDRRVRELDLSGVSLHAVDSENIRFVGELVRLSAPEARRVFKTKKTSELRKALVNMNLDFGTDIGEWRPPRTDEVAEDGSVPAEK